MTEYQPTYQPGEVVDIRIKDARIADCWPDDIGETVFVNLELPDDGRVAIHTSMSGLAITRRVPADGMPRPGEVWADRHDHVWFAAGVAGALVFVSQHTHTHSKTLDILLTDAGPIRRVWSGEDGARSDPR